MFYCTGRGGYSFIHLNLADAFLARLKHREACLAWLLPLRRALPGGSQAGATRTDGDNSCWLTAVRGFRTFLT